MTMGERDEQHEREHEQEQRQKHRRARMSLKGALGRLATASLLIDIDQPISDGCLKVLTETIEAMDEALHELKDVGAPEVQELLVP